VPLSFLTPRYDLKIIPANINCQGPPLTPLHRAWAFGEAIRRAADAVPQRVALVGTGGISHWPATPDSGKINEAWDREFLEHWQANDKSAMLAYTDEATYRDAGQGGFEIRTFIAVAAAARGRGLVQELGIVVHEQQHVGVRGGETPGGQDAAPRHESPRRRSVSVQRWLSEAPRAWIPHHRPCNGTCRRNTYHRRSCTADYSSGSPYGLHRAHAPLDSSGRMHEERRPA